MTWMLRFQDHKTHVLESEILARLCFFKYSFITRQFDFRSFSRFAKCSISIRVSCMFEVAYRNSKSKREFKLGLYFCGKEKREFKSNFKLFAKYLQKLKNLISKEDCHVTVPFFSFEIKNTFFLAKKLLLLCVTEIPFHIFSQEQELCLRNNVKSKHPWQWMCVWVCMCVCVCVKESVKEIVKERVYVWVSVWVWKRVRVTILIINQPPVGPVCARCPLFSQSWYI